MFQYDFIRYQDYNASAILGRINELALVGWEVVGVVDHDLIIIGRRLTSRSS